MFRNAIAIWFALVLVTPAGADGSPGEDVWAVDTLDEVVVTGRLDSLSGLRKALTAAEDRFYARWNEINDDDRLDIQCLYVAPTGRRIKQRRCDPRLVVDYTRAEAMRLFQAGGGNIKTRTVGDIRVEVANELKARTLLLLESDPQLRLSLLQRARLQQMYDELRSRKFEGRHVVWD